MKHLSKDIIQFQMNVLSWYDSNQRVLPWRESRDPYHIWISEIMLQQTRVETVIPFYNRFIKTLPNINALAKASEDLLYKLWEGLGYYSRVRNLKKAANQIISDFNGELPQDRKELETLLGIGPYTSGAISSIAFNKRNAAVDGNVLRIFARLYKIEESIKDISVKNDIKDKVETLLPHSRIGDFNQGLMEIGATICLPNGQPKCVLCPLNENCEAFRLGKTSKIPIKNTKKKTPVYNKTVLLLTYGDKYAIEKRPDTGLLQSMYQFPLLEGHLDESQVQELFKENSLDIKRLENSKHKFSHLSWNMIAYKALLSEKIDSYIYASKEEINNTISIPSAFKVYKELINK